MSPARPSHDSEPAVDRHPSPCPTFLRASPSRAYVLARSDARSCGNGVRLSPRGQRRNAGDPQRRPAPRCDGTSACLLRRPFRNDGEIRLRGPVGSLREKREARTAAQRVYGVLSVDNRLQARLLGNRGRADADLRGDVLQARVLDSRAPKTVDAKVEDGSVTLTGTMNSQHANGRSRRDDRRGVGGAGRHIAARHDDRVLTTDTHSTTPTSRPRRPAHRDPAPLRPPTPTPSASGATRHLGRLPLHSRGLWPLWSLWWTLFRVAFEVTSDLSATGSPRCPPLSVVGQEPGVGDLAAAASVADERHRCDVERLDPVRRRRAPSASWSGEATADVSPRPAAQSHPPADHPRPRPSRPGSPAR
jgi:hypothetical protein